MNAPDGPSTRLSRRDRWILAAVIAALACALGLYQRRVAARPAGGVILDFEDEAQLKRLVWLCPTRMERTPAIAASGRYALTAHLKPGLYPGVEIWKPPGDWSGYKALAFDIEAPRARGEKLHLRIDDKRSGTNYDDRYEGRFELTGERQHIVVPLADIRRGPPNGPLDLSRITKMVIYLYRQDHDVAMTLDDIRLIR